MNIQQVREAVRDLAERDDESGPWRLGEEIVAWLDDSLDAAWQEAEAALPEGWFGPNLGPERLIRDVGTWRAFAWGRANLRSQETRLITGWADTPAAALRALAVKLREGRE